MLVSCYHWSVITADIVEDQLMWSGRPTNVNNKLSLGGNKQAGQTDRTEQHSSTTGHTNTLTLFSSDNTPQAPPDYRGAANIEIINKIGKYYQ